MKLEAEEEPEIGLESQSDQKGKTLNNSNLNEARKKSSFGGQVGKFFLVLTVFLILAAATSRFLLKDPPGRSNLVVLGISGQGHAGSDLTDAMIFVSLDYRMSKILLLSLPRDIWVSELRTKLNSVYHYQGVDGTKKIVGGILGQEISHYLLIDFSIFQKAIDLLGGVEVKVAKSFDDYHYPITGKENDLCNGDPEFKCRYEHVHFDAGLQLMNGETALKYVRSRYAEGEEGSDFARSLRQQNLLLAVKNKLLSKEFLAHPKLAIQLIKLAKSSIKTDYPSNKYIDLVKMASRYRSLVVKTEVLNGNRLVNPPSSKKLYDSQWVLVPEAGNWEEVQNYVKQLLTY